MYYYLIVFFGLTLSAQQGFSNTFLTATLKDLMVEKLGEHLESNPGRLGRKCISYLLAKP